MYTEEYTQMLIDIATLLDVEIEEVKKFLELMLDGYNFEDGVNGCSLTTVECYHILKNKNHHTHKKFHSYILKEYHGNNFKIRNLNHYFILL